MQLLRSAAPMNRAWITEPGTYDLTEAEYHADPVVGGSLSSTGARILVNYCPARYAWERENGRPDRPHFDEGRAAHTKVLGVGAPLYVPCDDDGVPYERWQSNDAKAKVAAARDRGETPVKADVARRVDDMAAELARHPIAGPLFARPGRAEQSFVARDPDTKVMCRVRVDWMPDVEPGQRLILVDYKGCTCAEPGTFARRMAELGYDQQGAFYRAALVWLLELQVPPAFVLVAQEKEPPYLVTVAEPEDYVLDGAADLNREALATYARCDAAGVWPGYPPGPHRLGVPGWRSAAYEAAAARRFEARDHLIGVSA